MKKTTRYIGSGAVAGSFIGSFLGPIGLVLGTLLGILMGFLYIKFPRIFKSISNTVSYISLVLFILALIGGMIILIINVTYGWLVLPWLACGIFIGSLGNDREIGFVKSLIVSLLFSPIIGGITILASNKLIK